MHTSTEITTPNKIMLSVKEFCMSAGIGRTLFYEEVKSGRLIVKKVGKRTLIPTTELTDWPGRLPSPNEQAVA